MALLAAIGALALAPSAQAARVAIAPVKQCYRSGERVAIGGVEFSPNSFVRITENGLGIPGQLTTNTSGTFLGTIPIRRRSGQGTNTYQAIDGTNPGLSASVGIPVTALNVSVRPSDARVGRRFRIGARGFIGQGVQTSAKNVVLYAHVVRRGFRRNIKLGRVKGACGKLKVRKRLFARGTRPGRYKVQYDAKRRYSSKTRIRVVYSYRIRRIIVPRGAAASTATVSAAVATRVR